MESFKKEKINFLQHEELYFPELDSQHYCKCITLAPGLQLRYMEIKEHNNISVNFQSNAPHLEFGCLVSGNICGCCKEGSEPVRYFDEGPGKTWCSYYNRARGDMEYLSGQPVSIVAFVISGDLLQALPLIPQIKKAFEGQKSFYATGTITPEIGKILEQITRCSKSGNVSQELLLISKAYELLSRISALPHENDTETYSMEKHQGVIRAQEILNKNLASPPKLSDIARQSGLCITNLTSEFKKQSGTTVFGYLREQRLARAKELITLHGMNASEAAWEVGYSSLSSFHRAFCQRYGTTPGSYGRRL